MTIRWGVGVTIVDEDWTTLKSRVSAKALLLQYEQVTFDNTYVIFAFDTPTLVYTATIWLGTLPDGVIAGGRTQVQNDTDKADFEANYKPNANQRILASTPTPLTILGYTTTSSTGFTAIRGTIYTEQTTNAQRSVVSSSANDTSAGTGARTVRITYYDQTMAGPFTEDVTLNGVAAVNTVSTTICYIESITVQTAGATNGNAGTISLMSAAAGGGVTVGSIAPGDNQTQWAHHYVASTKKAFVTGVTGSIKGAYGGELHLRRATPTVANSVEQTTAPIVRVEPGRQSGDDYNSAPIAFSGPVRLTLYAKALNAASFDWQAGLSLFEVG